MLWNIVADSSCDLRKADIECSAVGFDTVPFIFKIGDAEYVDEENLDTMTLIEAMESCSTASSSACPSPHAWEELFMKAENTIAITISGNLSGSLNSALLAKENVLADHPEKKIAVLDSCSTGPECAMCIRKIAEWIKEGLDFETIVARGEEFLKNTRTCFALSSFDNLVKNGRMSRIAGFMAKALGMWGIGIASDIGTIVIRGKARGNVKALALITNIMKEYDFSGGTVTISHCCNLPMAEMLKTSILSQWPNTNVDFLETRGLDSYYAERGGLIVAFGE